MNYIMMSSMNYIMMSVQFEIIHIKIKSLLVWTKLETKISQVFIFVQYIILSF